MRESAAKAPGIGIYTAGAAVVLRLDTNRLPLLIQILEKQIVITFFMENARRENDTKGG